MYVQWVVAHAPYFRVFYLLCIHFSLQSSFIQDLFQQRDSLQEIEETYCRLWAHRQEAFIEEPVKRHIMHNIKKFVVLFGFLPETIINSK